MGNNDNFFNEDHNYNNNFLNHGRNSTPFSFKKEYEKRKRRWKEASLARKIFEVCKLILVLLIIF